MYLNKVNKDLTNLKKKISYIFKIKSVNPRLATGAIGTVIILFSFLIEVMIGLPLISEYMIVVIIISVIPVLLLDKKFASKYDPKNNDNIKVSIFLFSFIIIFGTIVTIVGLNRWR